MKEQLVKFIKDNELNFNATGSGLNSACVIICGYALSLGIKDSLEVDESVIQLFPEFSGTAELVRVFDYANTSGYGDWWSKPEAKKMYKF